MNLKKKKSMCMAKEFIINTAIFHKRFAHLDFMVTLR